MPSTFPCGDTGIRTLNRLFAKQMLCQLELCPLMETSEQLDQEVEADECYRRTLEDGWHTIAPTSLQVRLDWRRHFILIIHVESVGFEPTTPTLPVWCAAVAPRPQVPDQRWRGAGAGELPIQRSHECLHGNRRVETPKDPRLSASGSRHHGHHENTKRSGTGGGPYPALAQQPAGVRPSCG